MYTPKRTVSAWSPLSKRGHMLPSPASAHSCANTRARVRCACARVRALGHAYQRCEHAAPARHALARHACQLGVHASSTTRTCSRRPSTHTDARVRRGGDGPGRAHEAALGEGEEPPPDPVVPAGPQQQPGRRRRRRRRRQRVQPQRTSVNEWQWATHDGVGFAGTYQGPRHVRWRAIVRGSARTQRRLPCYCERCVQLRRDPVSWLPHQATKMTAATPVMTSGAPALAAFARHRLDALRRPSRRAHAHVSASLTDAGTGTTGAGHHLPPAPIQRCSCLVRYDCRYDLATPNALQPHEQDQHEQYRYQREQYQACGGQHAVSTRSARGPRVVSRTRSNQHAVGTRSARGRHAVSAWSAPG